MFALPVNSTCVVLMFSPVSDLQIHIFSEPICAVLYRQLSNKHPLNELLKYHCRGLIAVNAIGAPPLFFPLGYMDRLSAMGRKGTVLLLSRGLKTFSWKLADLHLDMKVRKAYVLLPTACPIPHGKRQDTRERQNQTCLASKHFVFM